MLCPDRTYLLTSSARPVCTSIQYRPHSQLLNCQRTTAACRAADGQPTWLENAAAPEQPSSPPQPLERQPPWNLSFDIRERETDWTDENKVSHETIKVQHLLGSGHACMETTHTSYSVPWGQGSRLAWYNQKNHVKAANLNRRFSKQKAGRQV